MKALQIKQVLMEHYRKQDPPRQYLGMSGIGRCQRELYFSLLDSHSGQAPSQDDRMQFYNMTGYALEAAVIQRLGVEQVTSEIVAEFDPRFMGHTDHEFADGDLVEIKSMNWKRFSHALATHQPYDPHVCQCQAYMRHGGFPHAVLIYVPRDIPHNEWEHTDFELPFLTFDVFTDRTMQNALDDKARKILRAFDSGIAPRCTCRWCKR
jgi:hypothetical protein